jgi:predicted nucleic acid-binding protein
MSKYCGKRVYASKYLEIIHKDSLKFNSRRVIGTIGIIIIAKNEQKIEAVNPLLNQLDQIGFRISRELTDAAASLAGEKED